MERCDLEVATEFLLIAATLVELKTRRLLPEDTEVDLDDEQGNHLSMLAGGRRPSGVVGQSQISPEPHHTGGHDARLRRRRIGPTRRANRRSGRRAV
jgi:segregation and condensation protein A